MACKSNVPSGRLIFCAHGIIILLTQNSSQLTLSCHRCAMHYTGNPWLVNQMSASQPLDFLRSWYNIRKGQSQWTHKHLPSFLEQMLMRPFDERSEPGKPKVFRVSARNLQ
jgi:hypothetical protein